VSQETANQKNLEPTQTVQFPLATPTIPVWSTGHITTKSDSDWTESVSGFRQLDQHEPTQTGCTFGLRPIGSNSRLMSDHRGPSNADFCPKTVSN
jgi:hypothetical protein